MVDELGNIIWKTITTHKFILDFPLGFVDSVVETDLEREIY